MLDYITARKLSRKGNCHSLVDGFVYEVYVKKPIHSLDRTMEKKAGQTFTAIYLSGYVYWVERIGPKPNKPDATGNNWKIIGSFFYDSEALGWFKMYIAGLDWEARWYLVLKRLIEVRYPSTSVYCYDTMSNVLLKEGVGGARSVYWSN